MTSIAYSLRLRPFFPLPPMIPKGFLRSGLAESTLAPPVPDVPSSSAFSADAEPIWLPGVMARLEHLVSLPEGWDGHGGRAVSVSTALFALHILFETLDRSRPSPQILPLSYGGLQIEWHEQGIDLEVEIIGSNEILVTFEDHVMGDSDQFSLSTDLSRLSNLLSLLTVRASR